MQRRWRRSLLFVIIQGGGGAGLTCQVVAVCCHNVVLVVVLGKFGLVWFEALFAKPETKPFGFFQIF